MGAQMAAMAVPCARCGKPFDLSYDLEGEGGETTLSEVMQALRAVRKRKAVLCWECRMKYRN